MAFFSMKPFPIAELGFAEKVFSTSATRRQSEAVYEYCELKPTNEMMR